MALKIHFARQIVRDTQVEHAHLWWNQNVKARAETRRSVYRARRGWKTKCDSNLWATVSKSGLNGVSIDLHKLPWDLYDTQDCNIAFGVYEAIPWFMNCID